MDYMQNSLSFKREDISKMKNEKTKRTLKESISISDFEELLRRAVKTPSISKKKRVKPEKVKSQTSAR